MTKISKGNFINGKWVSAFGGQLFSMSPSDNSVIWDGRLSNERDLDSAIQASNAVLEKWSNLSIDERLVYLNRFVELVGNRKEEIADAISLEVGKPRWESVTEVDAVIGKLAPTIEAYQTRASTLTRSTGSAKSYTRFLPHGVAVVLSPINFPIHMGNGHIMPALLAGNTVIWKPSELCPMVAEMLIELWSDTGIPPGVINLVQGKSEAAQYLIRSKSINAVLFTGSRSAGLAINQALANEPWKIVALEMGGDSPLVVWDYLEMKSAVFIAIQSAYITSGQRCSAARRLIVKKNDKEFLNQLALTIKRIKVSPPNETPQPYMGPMVSALYAQRLLDAQDKLISDGAVSIVKSELLRPNSALVSPGLIDVTNIRSRDCGEIFGPLLQVITVDTFADAILEANRSSYGLAAGLISRDKRLFEIFLHQVKAGIINWNQQLTGATSYAPFGGIKESGNNRPSGSFAVDYCSYPVASLEVEEPTFPGSLPPGLSL